MYCKGVKDWTALDRVEATGWIKRWVGQRAYDVLWDKLFRLKFFEHTENLSAAWIAARLARVAKSRKSLFVESMGYLEGGSEVLIRELAARIAAMGGRVEVNMPVTRVLTANGRVRGVQAGERVIECDAAISTVPLKYVPAMAPDLKPEELEKIRAIENIGVVCVLLKLKRPLSRYFWMNTNDESMAIPGIIEYTNLNPLAHHVVYVPFYMPQTHPRYARPSEEFVAEVMGYVKRINPQLQDDWVLATHVSRYQFAQTVCTPNFFAKLPPLATSIGGFLMADTSFYYPEDRSISESVLVGKKLAAAADASA
jgi:protoporphyrinogen oxidase